MLTENELSAVARVVPQAFEPALTAVGSLVVALLLSLIVMSLGSKLKPVQYTGSEKLTVIAVPPVLPLAEVTVGAVTSGWPAVFWRLCGAAAGLPATSVMCSLSAPAVVGVASVATLRVVSTNAPAGIAVVRIRFALVVESVEEHRGMLSLRTTSFVALETLFTDQSVPAVPAVARQTGSLNVTVKMSPVTVNDRKTGAVVSEYA